MAVQSRATLVSPWGDRGLEDDSNRDGAALPQSIVDRWAVSQ